MSERNAGAAGLASIQVSQDLSEVFEYSAQVKAMEAFRNAMLKEGIKIDVWDRSVKFASPRRFDFRKLQAKGIIGAYTVTKLRVNLIRQLVEEG